MLEEIYDENWGKLKTQSSNASHVPDALLALITENEEEFERAYWRLENHIVVQGDLYSAAAVVPKYLEEIYLKTKFKHGVSELLVQIGSGYSIDSTLVDTCFSEVVRVFNSLLSNPNIRGSEYEQALKEDLTGVIELHNENGT
jgi:hypothetical protein